jgi:hypothetical protein
MRSPSKTLRTSAADRVSATSHLLAQLGLAGTAEAGDAVGRVIRLYRSNDGLGEPRWSPEGQPYQAADFPATGDTTYGYVGAVPLDVREDISDWTAVADALFKASARPVCR